MITTQREVQAIIERVSAAHGITAGSVSTPIALFTFAKHLRAEFEAAGATWEQIASFVAGTVDAALRDPGLTTEQSAVMRQALADGFNVMIEADAGDDRQRVTYKVTDLARE